jgi:hypothetical protein
MELWKYTWPEVQEAASRREVLSSWEGYLISSRDRAFDPRAAQGHHRFAVAKAIAKGYEVPEAVRQEYEARIVGNGIDPEHAAKAAFDPAPVLTDDRLFNAKGKPFSWSFSAISDFTTCPYQYAAKRYYISVPFEDTEATLWGSRVHKALEDRVKDGVPLPEGMGDYEKYARVIAAQGSKGALFCEKQLAVDGEFRPTGWFDKDAEGRAVADVLIIQGRTAYIFDYKTGKVKDDPLQLEITSLLTGLAFPDVDEFITKFIWLKFGQITGGTVRREDLPKIRQRVELHTDRMKEAWRTKVFVPRSSGLCRGWCPVEECKHWREKR